MKIMVVDDHAPSLLKITSHIKSFKKYRLLATACGGHGLIKYCYHQKELPDIVLLDVEMHKMDGVTAMEFMGMYFPEIKVIALSAHIDNQVVCDMLAAGALGYVFKDRELTCLEEAMDLVIAGKVYVDRRLFFDTSKRQILMEQRKFEKERLYLQYNLSRREKEILALLVSNMDYGEIGGILNISPKTIEHAVNSLTKKFDITNGRTGLLLHSLRVGLTRMVSLKQA